MLVERFVLTEIKTVIILLLLLLLFLFQNLQALNETSAASVVAYKPFTIQYIVAGTIQSTHTYQYTQNPLQNTVLDDGSILGLTANL